MYKINFNHLYYFITIAKEGSIVKASKKLNITQPALSHQLKILEEDLGKKLFDRKGKRLVINENGQQVKQYASKIFRHSEEMINSLQNQKNEYIKIIKVGTVPWLSNKIVYDTIKPLIFNHHIQVQVFEKSLETLISDVQNDRLDFILCDAPYSGRSKKLQGHQLVSEKIFCVANAKEKLKQNFPKNLNHKKYINFSEASVLRDDIDYFIKLNKIEMDKVGEFTNAALIKKAIEAGGVIGFLPESLVQDSLKSHQLIKLGELKRTNHHLWAITKKDYKQDGLIVDLLKKFRKKSAKSKLNRK